MTLLERYRGFVLDLDGTVYLGDALLPGLRRAIAAMRAADRAVLYVTNKPLDPPASYAEKLTGLGVPTGADEVISSLDALVAYLLEFHAGATSRPAVGQADPAPTCVFGGLADLVLARAGQRPGGRP
jgi:NagD protein